MRMKFRVDEVRCRRQTDLDGSPKVQAVLLRRVPGDSMEERQSQGLANMPIGASGGDDIRVTLYEADGRFFEVGETYYLDFQRAE